MSSNRFEGRTALVTGGAGDIGAAIVKRLASEGARVATLDLAAAELDEWRRVHAINCDGVFFANRAAAAVMVPRGYGRIVNVASIAGKEGNPMAAAYSSSQAAALIEYLASEQCSFSTAAVFDVSGGRATY